MKGKFLLWLQNFQEIVSFISISEKNHDTGLLRTKVECLLADHLLVLLNIFGSVYLEAFLFLVPMAPFVV